MSDLGHLACVGFYIAPSGCLPDCHMQQRTQHLYLSRAIPGSYVASVLHHIYAASFSRQYIIPCSVIIYCYYRVSYVLRNVILLTLEIGRFAGRIELLFARVIHLACDRDEFQQLQPVPLCVDERQLPDGIPSCSPLPDFQRSHH